MRRPRYLQRGCAFSRPGHWTTTSSAKLYSICPDNDSVFTRHKLSTYTTRFLQTPRIRSSRATKHTGTHVPGPLVRTRLGRWRVTERAEKMRAHRVVKHDDTHPCPTSLARGTTSMLYWPEGVWVWLLVSLLHLFSLPVCVCKGRDDSIVKTKGFNSEKKS